ncbi:28764_t:CDS:1, partial [Racocetra persica]
ESGHSVAHLNPVDEMANVGRSIWLEPANYLQLLKYFTLSKKS